MEQTYKYRAIDASGKTIESEITGKSVEDVRAKLKNLKYIPISVSEFSKAEEARTKDILPEKVKPRDVMLFCKQMGVMMGAGVPINTALDLFQQQADNKTLKATTQQVKADIQKGESLSKAMKKYPKVFPPLLLRMMEAGELSGRMDDVLAQMAEHYEREVATTRQVKKAMTYPILLIVISIVAVIIVMIAVVPIFADMYSEAGMDLPKITQMVMAISNSYIKYWYIHVLIVGVIAFFIYLLTNTPDGRRFLDTALLRLPGIRKPMQMIITARFTRTFATLTSSGVPLVEAVRSSAGTTNNVIVEEAVEGLTDNIRKGSSLGSQFAKIEYFPTMMTSMIRIGEESGSLDEMLGKTADFYDDELTAAVDQLVGMIEPIAIIVMGVLVGGIVASVFLPLFGAGKAVQQSQM